MSSSSTSRSTRSHATRSLRLDLVDQQVLDSTERPVGRIDEVDLELGDDGALLVLGFRMGAASLGRRIGGSVGSAMTRSAERLAESEASPFVPISELEKWQPRLQLRKSLAELSQVAGLERWLGVHVVSKVPGGGDARV